MKMTLIFCITFTLFLTGCSSSEDTVSKHNMQVIDATFSQWSEPPQAGSDIPERGIDLRVNIRNWPQEYKPNFIVHNGRKSLSTAITDSTEKNIVITGRIIRSSGVMAETSKSIEVSDRLVFINKEGDSGFIEIDNWQRSDKE